MFWGSLPGGRVPLEAHSGPKPFAQLSLLGLGIRDAERSALAASRRHRRPERPGPLPGTTGSWGEALGIEAKSLERRPLLCRAHPVRQVLLVCPYAGLPAAASMRGASRGLQIPGVRGARPAPPAVPAPGARGSPALPGRPRLPGWSGAAGGAAVVRRGWAGRPGVRECGSGGPSAAAGLSHRSPPAAPRDGGEQLAGGGAQEDPQPAGAGGRRGGARGQLAARAGLREEAEGDRKGPTQHPTPPSPSPPTPGGAPSRAARPLEPTDLFPHAPGRTLAEGAGSAGALHALLCPSIPRLWSKVKALRGSRSGVEKVLEAALSQKGAPYLGCLRSVRLSPVPQNVHFVLQALFTQRVGRREGNPFGNPFLWDGASAGQVGGSAKLWGPGMLNSTIPIDPSFSGSPSSNG